MPPPIRVTIVEAELRLDIDYSDTKTLQADDSLVIGLFRTCKDMHKRVLLRDFDFKETNTLTLFDYRFEAQDGRQWKQTIDFNGSEPSMTFDVEDAWLLSEFEPHRAIRALCMALYNQFRVTRVHMRWEEE